MGDWIAIGAMGLVGVGIPLAIMAVSALLRPNVPEQGKSATCESGEVPAGTARVQFNIQYYMVALLFFVLDIKTVLVFPWMVIYRSALEQGASLATILTPMLVFIGILIVGLVWAWRNGAVKWVKSPQANRRKIERQDA